MAIEKQTFSQIALSTDELVAFQTICIAQRRQWLTLLHLNIVLPRWQEPNARGKRRPPNDEAFTWGIKNLLYILQSWENDFIQGRIHLHLGQVIVATDAVGDDEEEEDAETMDFSLHPLESPLVHLTQHGALPAVHNVSRFSVGRYLACKVHLRAILEIAASFPSLRDVFLDLDDGENLHPDRRRANRRDFVQALQGGAFSTLKSLKLFFRHSPPRGRQLTSLIESRTPCDTLSTALRVLSYNLISLEVAGVVDFSLFWPANWMGDVHGVYPSWPYLQTLIVTFDLMTPDGYFYFDGDDDEDMRSPSSDDRTPSPVEIVRNIPNEDALAPLVEAFTRATQRMRVLTIASLATQIDVADNGGSGGEWAMTYLAPGRKLYLDVDAGCDAGGRRLYFETGDWRPEERAMEMWREVGRERYGGELIERFLKIRY